MPCGLLYGIDALTHRRTYACRSHPSADVHPRGLSPERLQPRETLRPVGAQGDSNPYDNPN
jgi:hypothetical protein